MNIKKILTFFLSMVIVFSLGCQNKNDNAKTAALDESKGENSYSNLKGNEKLYAIIETGMGKIEILLFDADAPKTVNNFVSLAQKGYYNGIIFHRVIEGFMIQGGDPTGTGMGGESIYGKPFEDEFSIALRHDSPGILSMANSGPNTNGSQFFITVAATPWLDLRHSVFGKVIKGLDIVYAISKVPTGNMDRPVQDVVMKSVTIEKRDN